MIIQRLFSYRQAENFKKFAELNLDSNIEIEDRDNIFSELNDNMKESIINIINNKEQLAKYVLNHERDSNSLNRSNLVKDLKIFNVSINKLKDKILLEVSLILENNPLYNNGFWNIEFQLNNFGKLVYINTCYND